MAKKYKVITLCGSRKFRDEFISNQKRLTLEGNIVLSIVFFDDFCDLKNLADETKTMISDMHKQKIDMSDEIFVINKGEYIGQSTKSEIEYAKMTNKKVNYLEPIK